MNKASDRPTQGSSTPHPHAQIPQTIGKVTHEQSEKFRWSVILLPAARISFCGAQQYLPLTLIDELLEALSFVRFGYVDIPFGIGCNIVRAIELAGPVSAASELANNLQ